METGVVPVTVSPDLQAALRENLYWFLHPHSFRLDEEGVHAPGQVARLLAAGYAALDGRPRREDLHVVVKQPPAFCEEQYLRHDAAYRQPVAALARFAQEKLTGYLSHFYLHGSMASEDYSLGWSDVDTLMVVSRATLIDPQSLLVLRQHVRQAYGLLLEVDPLQHHGFILTTEIDLECYPTMVMPPVVLDHALSLLPGRDEIIFHCRDCRAEIRAAIHGRVALMRQACDSGEFRHHARNGVYLQSQWRNADDAMYQLKYFLSVVMIQPSYLQEALGAPCFKRDSFDLCRSALAPHWEIVEKASAIRCLWPRHQSHPFQGNSVPEWVKDILGPDYFVQAHGLVAAIARILAT